MSVDKKCGQIFVSRIQDNNIRTLNMQERMFSFKFIITGNIYKSVYKKTSVQKTMVFIFYEKRKLFAKLQATLSLDTRRYKSDESLSGLVFSS